MTRLDLNFMVRRRPPSQVIWQKIENNNGQTGHLAFYYSNQKTELPVRDVAKRWDNKSDPNIETKTYGMFSTCMPPARKNMVERGDSYIFFFTRRKKQRILTGYYELDKFVPTGITPTRGGKPSKFKDIALLAKRTHFVRDGIPFTGKTWSKIKSEYIQENEIEGFGPRDFVKVDVKMTKKLKKLLDKQKDVTDEYVKEVHNLENTNKENFGKKYPTWKRNNGFTIKDFGDFVQ